MGRRSEPVLPLVLFVIGLYVCIWYGAVYMAMTAKKALNPKDGKKKDTKGAVVASVVSLVCFACAISPLGMFLWPALKSMGSGKLIKESQRPT